VTNEQTMTDALDDDSRIGSTDATEQGGRR
jgi:hypothetical protein